MSKSQHGFNVVGNVGRILKKNLHTVAVKPIIRNENKMDKSWEIVEMYTELKDSCDNHAIELLDECNVMDLFDFVFRENTNYSSK